jgi:PilZ domain
VGKLNVEKRSQFEMSGMKQVVDARRHRRFRIDVKVSVYPRNSPVVHGDTVDIRESGISAILREEVPVGEVIRLEFALPFGEVELLALVRHRSAFRYGFQFVEPSSVNDVIGRTCVQLATEQQDRKPEGGDLSQ